MLKNSSKPNDESLLNYAKIREKERKKNINFLNKYFIFFFIEIVKPHKLKLIFEKHSKKLNQNVKIPRNKILKTKDSL